MSELLDKIVIIDELMPSIFADNLEEMLLSNNFPWFYQKDLTSPEDKEIETPGFCHLLVDHGHAINNYFDSLNLKYIPHRAIKQIDKNCTFKIEMVRSFLQLPIINERKFDNKHIDMDINHLVCLYYVNNNDAETYFFDGEDIIKKIKPQKNRVVVFDGSIYHASSSPKTNERVVINFNLI